MAVTWLVFLSAFGLLTSISGNILLVDSINSTAKCESYDGECQTNGGDYCTGNKTDRIGRCDEKGSTCCINNNTALCERFFPGECLEDGETCSDNNNLLLTCSDGRVCCSRKDITPGGGSVLKRLLIKALVRLYDPGNSTSNQLGNTSGDKKTGGRNEKTEVKREKMDGGKGRMCCGKMKGCMRKNRKMCKMHKERKAKRMEKMGTSRELKMTMPEMCLKMMQKMMKKMKMKMKKMKNMKMMTMMTPTVNSNSTAVCMSLNGRCCRTPDECDNSTSVVAGSCDDAGSVCCVDPSKMRGTKVKASENRSRVRSGSGDNVDNDNSDSGSSSVNGNKRSGSGGNGNGRGNGGSGDSSGMSGKHAKSMTDGRGRMGESDAAAEAK